MVGLDVDAHDGSFDGCAECRLEPVADLMGLLDGHRASDLTGWLWTELIARISQDLRPSQAGSYAPIMGRSKYPSGLHKADIEKLKRG